MVCLPLHRGHFAALSRLAFCVLYCTLCNRRRGPHPRGHDLDVRCDGLQLHGFAGVWLCRGCVDHRPFAGEPISCLFHAGIAGLNHAHHPHLIVIRDAMGTHARAMTIRSISLDGHLFTLHAHLYGAGEPPCHPSAPVHRRCDWLLHDPPSGNGVVWQAIHHGLHLAPPVEARVCTVEQLHLPAWHV